MDCAYATEIDIELFAVGAGKSGEYSKEPSIDLFLVVLCPNGRCHAYKHSLDYFLTLSTTVPSGRYTILAGSMSAVRFSKSSPFNLVVHASRPFVLSEKSSTCELVRDAFVAVALQANNRKVFGDGVSILTFRDNGFVHTFHSSFPLLSLLCRGFGFVCENNSKRAIRLTTDFQGSTNVISSRRTFHMVDIIPANTRQLFAMFTRKMLCDDVHIGKYIFLILDLSSLLSMILVYQLEYQVCSLSRTVIEKGFIVQTGSR